MPTNILAIVIDDLGAADLGCTGSTFHETPHLDALAADGLLCREAYASCPVCSPSRASLLSGQAPARVGITDWIGAESRGRLAHVPFRNSLPEGLTTLPAVLQAAGWQTWHVGKWHLGEGPSAPERRGFDINIGGCGWGAPRHGFWSPYRCPALSDGPVGEHLTDRLTDEAIALLRRRDRSRPFFLNLWHYAVHVPIQAPADLVAYFRAKAQRLGLDPVGDVVEAEAFGVSHLLGRRLTRRQRQSDPAYAAMLAQLDAAIGRLLAVLDAEGLRDDTLLWFTSDNGGLSTAEGAPTCNAPWRDGKGWLSDGGVRVPQILRLPGRIPRGISRLPQWGCDLMPTALAAAGLPLRPADHADGCDLLPLLASGASERPSPLCWHYPHYSNQGGRPGSAIRDGAWKLIEHFEDGRCELYHLPSDAGEEHERSRQEPARARALQQRLAAWRRSVSAAIPRPDAAWAGGGDPAEV